MQRTITYFLLSLLVIIVTVLTITWLSLDHKIPPPTRSETTVVAPQEYPPSPPLEQESAPALPSPVIASPNAAASTLPPGPKKGIPWLDAGGLQHGAQLAWIAAVGLNPEDSTYETDLLEKAKSRKTAQDPWSIQGWKEFRDGEYNGVMTGLGSRGTPEQFVIEIRREELHRETQTSWSLKPLSLRWEHHWGATGEKSPLFNLADHRPLFADQELFFGALHLPPSAMGPLFDAQGNEISAQCREVIWIHSILTSTSRSVEGISGRCFCRITREQLIGVGQFVIMAR